MTLVSCSRRLFVIWAIYEFSKTSATFTSHICVLQCARVIHNVREVSNSGKRCVNLARRVWVCCKVSEAAAKCARLPQSVRGCRKVCEAAAKCASLPWNSQKNKVQAFRYFWDGGQSCCPISVKFACHVYKLEMNFHTKFHKYPKIIVPVIKFFYFLAGSLIGLVPLNGFQWNFGYWNPRAGYIPMQKFNAIGPSVPEIWAL